MKSRILIGTLAAITLLTGCRDYTAFGRNTSEDIDQDVLNQAIEEEKNAMKNAGIITTKGKRLANTLSSNYNFDYSVDKQGSITLTSPNMEIYLTEEDVKTIYFILFDGHPLENEKIIKELYSVMNDISGFLNVTYNESAINESLSNVDYSLAYNNYTNDYSEDLYLFSNLWNDGTRDCIDFRIYPKD